mgnify:CR=1 FL=1
MAITVNIDVSFGQLCVFQSTLKDPFSEWTDEHVAQGFAWRPGSASFRSVVDAGEHRVDISVVNHLEKIGDDVVRAIEVPFEVSEDGAVEIGSIADTVVLNLPPGSYLLRCEFLHPITDAFERTRLTFAKGEQPRFKVALADSMLSPGGEILTIALPA